MVLRTARGLQVQAVDRHATVLGLQAHLLGVQTSGRQLAVTIDCARIGNQYDVACTELIPFDLIQRLHHAGVGVFVVTAAGRSCRFELGDLGQEVFTVLDRARVDVHLADVFKLGHFLGAGAVGD